MSGELSRCAHCGRRLGEPKNDPPYGEWVAMYCGGCLLKEVWVDGG